MSSAGTKRAKLGIIFDNVIERNRKTDDYELTETDHESVARYVNDTFVHQCSYDNYM